MTDKPFAGVEADLHAMGLFDGEELPEAYRDLPGAGDVKTAFKKLTLLRPERPERLLIVGLGEREGLDAERMRVAAALAVIRAGRYEAETIAWSLPEAAGDPSPPGACRRRGRGNGARLLPVRPLQVPRPRGSGAAQDRAPAAGGRRRGSKIAQDVEAARVASEAANRARGAPGPALERGHPELPR